jgi:ferredoxin
MALIYQPRQMLKDGKPSGLWRMTVASDEEGWCTAVGACAKDCPGHATADDAEKHWHEGELAKATFDGVDDDQQKKCLVCAAWTQRSAIIPGEFYAKFPLCGIHLNMESLRSVYPPLQPLQPKPAKSAESSQANSSPSA